MNETPIPSSEPRHIKDLLSLAVDPNKGGLLRDEERAAHVAATGHQNEARGTAEHLADVTEEVTAGRLMGAEADVAMQQAQQADLEARAAQNIQQQNRLQS